MRSPLAVATSILVGITVYDMRDAGACVPAPYRDGVGRPQLEGEATIADEQLAPIECDGRRCTIETRYRLEVATPSKLSVAMSGHGELAVTLDGAVLDTANLPRRATTTWGLHTRTFQTDVPTGSHALVVVAKLELSQKRSCFSPGILARHPVLGSGRVLDSARLVVETAQQPTVRISDDWSVEVSEARKDSPTDETYDRSIWLERDASTFLHGGPFLLAGASSGPGKLLRARGGWEVARHPMPVFAVFGETDFDELVTVGATAEAITPAWIVPVTLSAGAGALATVHPTVQPGVRALASLAFGPVRVVLNVDAMIPAGDEQDFELVIAALGGFSL